ncbi:hypothetical protein HK097_005291 [Rhizophlyctis rosea]|uniref:Uncharacterized protein n=1 Tax=Rhizophlyctis rosea TaxID=64517 RepID=A0AAD5X5K9_9FUNG|nr:hypothetical protein HK097_005291 [Rhizophlyctis rosea]
MAQRVFNSVGENLYTGIQRTIGTLFFIIMLFYAGFRGHRVVTQLPATFRTTQAPKSLPTDFLRQMFPSKIPSATYEFPSLTICPGNSGPKVEIVGCHLDGTARTDPCDPKGQYPRFYTFEGESLNCTAVNEWPGEIKSAGSNQEVLRVAGNLIGTREGNPQGVLVAAHPASVDNAQPVVDYENFFAVSALHLTEVSARKVYSIDMKNNVRLDYEVKASPIRMKFNESGYWDETAKLPFTIEFRYPKLEVTYQKEFLVLDMNNWLGEVGGVACLLYLLQKLAMAVVGYALKLSDNFAVTEGKYRNEGFNNY